jgi:membrane peptidoglycan carboxypeptidase
MSFAPIAILPPKTYPERLPTASRGRGIRSVGFLFARAVASLFGGIFLVHLALFLLTIWIGLVYSYLNPPITSLMILRHVDYHYTIKPVKFLKLSQLPPFVQRMFVGVEDKTFYSNPGINIKAMEDAWKANQRLGYAAYGASTITQQLTRSLFLDTTKSYLRKYTEIFMSLTLNLVMSKQRQLELYLNYIEWGRGVFGIGQAALQSYGKPVSKLTHDEIARLAAVIVAPVRFNVHTLFQNHEMVRRYEFLRTVK